MMIQSGVTEVCALPSAVALYVFKTMTFFIFYNSVQNEPILIFFLVYSILKIDISSYDFAKHTCKTQPLHLEKLAKVSVA